MPRRYAERDGGYGEMVVSRYHDIIRYELVADKTNPKRQIVHIIFVWHPAQDRYASLPIARIILPPTTFAASRADLRQNSHSG